MSHKHMLRIQVFWIVMLSSNIIIPEVSKEFTAFIFKGQEALEEPSSKAK
jgi:hypothetical protein